MLDKKLEIQKKKKKKKTPREGAREAGKETVASRRENRMVLDGRRWCACVQLRRVSPEYYYRGLSLKYCRENNKERTKRKERKKERKKKKKRARRVFRILEEKYRYYRYRRTIGWSTRVKGRKRRRGRWERVAEKSAGTIASLGIQVSTTRSYFLNKHARGRCSLR